MPKSGAAVVQDDAKSYKSMQANELCLNSLHGALKPSKKKDQLQCSAKTHVLDSSPANVSSRLKKVQH